MSGTATVPRGNTFAAVMFILLGTFNLFDGYALLNKAEWFGDQFIASNAETWGWVLLIFGVLQIIVGIMQGRSGGLATLGIVLASVSMFVWFCLLFVTPFASLIGVFISFSLLTSLMTEGATE